MTLTIYSTDHEQEAYRLGCDAGIAAASWVVDGNTPPDHIARVVAMLDDGDPMADDYLPECPNLSGEWADGPTPVSLYREITGDDDGPEDDHDRSIVDEIADAWEAGVSDTFEAECERILRAMLPEPEDTSEDRCTDHGLDECPDCGNGGTKIDSTGYVPCTRFLTCWADPDA